MSFSSKAKNEVVHIRTEGPCCNRAQLSGMVRVCGSLELGGLRTINLRMTTENPAVARLFFILLKKLYKYQGALTMKENKNLNKHHTYEVFIAGANDILDDLQIITQVDGAIQLNEGLPELLLKKPCCKRAYLRGIYLGSGSISAPNKSYHLELITHNDWFAEQLAGAMNSWFDLGAKFTQRKHSYIVYMKESEKIVDFLNIIGAHQTLLEYENVRIIKQMRNDVNRVVNCETANLNKTINAAYDQIHAIETIERNGGLKTLPDKLLEVAKLRLDNPEASLTELGEMLVPPIGKSGVNHRLKKIVSIAEKYESRG
ncbi:DNA-binding protein WhiA [Fusibacter sp. JL298sf-3]